MVVADTNRLGTTMTKPPQSSMTLCVGALSQQSNHLYLAARIQLTVQPAAVRSTTSYL